MKIQADNINGVYKVEEFDSGVEVMDQDTFYAQLDINPEGSVIGAEVDEDYVTIIDSEYGIH